MSDANASGPPPPNEWKELYCLKMASYMKKENSNGADLESFVWPSNITPKKKKKKDPYLFLGLWNRFS